jgi:hypothetical protein
MDIDDLLDGPGGSRTILPSFTGESRSIEYQKEGSEKPWKIYSDFSCSRVYARWVQ